MVPLKRIDKIRWEIPKYDKRMRVPGRVYADDQLIEKMRGDRTLEQAANVAMLPGIYKYSIVMPDGHQGYGFPIGGVAAFDVKEGVISPGGVGYDVNCLHEETEVISDLGFKIQVKNLPKSFKRVPLKVYDAKEGHNDHSRIMLVAERDSDEEIYEIKLTSGRVLKASGDHPVLTEKGYKKAEDLKPGDLVAVYPFEGVEYEEPEPRILLTHEDFKNEDRQLVKYLEERGLLPLRMDDPRIGILARVLGYFIGDGSFDIYREKNGRERMITVFYGDEEGLEALRKDLEFYFNIKASRVYKRTRKENVRTAWGEFETTGTEYSIKVTSKAFSKLLIKLGAPTGKKTDVDFDVPEWVKNTPKWIKRNFLAGLFGADGSKPRLMSSYHKYTPNSISLTAVKTKELEESLVKFLNSIKELLAEFEVTSHVRKVKEYDNRVMYRLVIYSNTREIYNFLSRIGYEYTAQKSYALIFAEYLRRKIVIGENISESNLVQRNRKMRELLPDFGSFLKTYGLEGGFVLDRVIEVKRVKSDSKKLYDIGVYHSAHNFIANGVVVHNCGVRLIRTNLTEKEVRPRIKELVDTLFKNVPSGLGSKGRVRLHWTQLDDVLADGAKWAVDNGYGWKEDLEHLEEGGRMEGANPNAVSQKAKQRGAPQLGSLGSGNHFLEVQVVDKVFDEKIAEAYGLFEGQVVVMVHTGSRGLGHQVASDYLRVMEKANRKYGIPWPDRELVSVPFQSEEGQRYFSAMKAAANFAWANRQMITHWVRESFEEVFKRKAEDMEMSIVYDVAHNIAKVEEHEVDGKKVTVVVHRKGATRAFPAGHPDVPRAYRDVGQPVLIPGSMGTASYVLAGAEGSMRETFGSSCHGAGRLLSRKAATRQYRGDRLRNELARQGIYIRAASLRVVAEEAPGAYKSVDNVVNVVHQAGIANLVARMRPMGVAKG
ncbi:RtcB family protein [Thermococcus aciditolerans]|uniref:tRNA-splicing ligase RtcB n=1 Tax=Thermococcus aciditolerans TaxID=2598455 RepID=A0A5C0SHX6_9EURY|nr:RtcB family protein [Thermococcus aciditolerans]QEK13941.1 RNA-splicing ligase RtcB [Thermococcus aciditolerans]